MAVTKLWPVKNRLDHVIAYAENPEKTVKANSKYSDADYQALRDVIGYAKNEKKTEMEYFCEGINCDPSTARDEFVMTKEDYGKTDGIQAYHGYLSFKEQDITPETAQEIGMEFAQRVWGDRFQVLVTTHLNTEHLHCHYVVNSVSFIDGKMLHGEEKAWFKFRHIADEICREYGLHVIEEPRGNSQPYYSYQQEKAGLPTKYNILRAVLDEALSQTTNARDLEYRLKKQGYLLNWSYYHKHWSIVPKGKKKPIRLYRLGEEYTTDRILQRMQENENKVIFRPFYNGKPQPRQYPMHTREHHIRRKRKGLRGLYLYYLYRLGYLPRYQKPNPARIPPALREDLIKIDEFSAQVRLLGRENIETAEELFAYKDKTQATVDALMEERKRLRNEVRHVGLSEDEIVELKRKISILSQRITLLRKDIDRCDKIAERSGVIAEKVQALLMQEQPKKEKHYSR